MAATMKSNRMIPSDTNRKAYGYGNSYGRRQWKSADGLFNESVLKSHATAMQRTNASRDDFSAFCTELGAPAEVINRVWPE